MSSTAMHQPLSQAIVETIAENEDVDPLALDPLYEVIDPDALDSLFAETNRSPRSDGKITFEYAGHTVVVNSDGTVRLADELTSVEEPL